MGFFVSGQGGRASGTPVVVRVVLRALLLGCVAARVAPAQFPPEVRGRVTDAVTGAPIAGAEILVPTLAGHVVTSADGSFVVRGLPPGPVAIGARRLGYASGTVSVELANGQLTVVAIPLHAIAHALDRVEARASRDSAAAPNATTVTREAIVASAASSVADVLEHEPGLVVTRRGGPGTPASVSIRGSESNQVLVLVDGIPVNDVLSGVADLSTIPTTSVERITVLRGAQTARYGPQALAGVVVVETRRPTEASGEITTTLGSWGNQRTALSASDAASAGDTRVAARLDADQRRVGSQFDYDIPAARGGGVGERDNDDSRERQLNAQLSLRRDQLGLSLRADWLDVNRGMPGSIVQPSLTGRQMQERRGTSLSARLTPDGWTVAGTVQAQRQSAHYLDPSPPFGGAFDTRVRAVTTLATLSFERALSGWSLTGGVEHRHIGASGTALRQDVDPAQALTSAWSEATWTHRLPRAVQADLSIDARLDDHSRLPSPVFSPRVQGTLARGSMSLFGSWGAAFAPPSLADLFFQEGVQTQSNPALAPERVKNEVTAGIRLAQLAIGPTRSSGEVTAFRADIDGMIIWFPDFRFVWRPDNFNVTRHGAEAQLTTALLDDALELHTNATYAKVDYTGAVVGGQVVYRPVWSGATMLSARLPTSVAADATWGETGRRTTNPGSLLNTIPAFGVLDLAVHRRFTTRPTVIDLRVGISNALDTHAVMLPDYPFPGRGWTVSVHLASRD